MNQPLRVKEKEEKIQRDLQNARMKTADRPLVRVYDFLFIVFFSAKRESGWG
jgi:hypothetical protein